MSHDDVIAVAESFKISVRSLEADLRDADRDYQRKLKEILVKIDALRKECPHPSKSRHYCQYESYDECDYCGKEL